MSVQSTVLVTGASTGIGATYADRFARRGHDLVLVARDLPRLTALADRLRTETGVAVDVLPADLTKPADLAAVEARLRDDARIDLLVNNAGTSLRGGFADQTGDDVAGLIGLNVIAPTRLASAVTPRFVAEGRGAIINIASVVGLAPEFRSTVYGATKRHSCCSSARACNSSSARAASMSKRCCPPPRGPRSGKSPDATSTRCRA
jgi:short-subunit dehydrogenase